MKAEITLTEKEFHRALAGSVGYSSDAAITEFFKWSDGSVTFVLATDEHKVPPPPAPGAEGASSTSVEDEIPF